jgi:hypothetical protein
MLRRGMDGIGDLAEENLFQIRIGVLDEFTAFCGPFPIIAGRTVR